MGWLTVKSKYRLGCYTQAPEMVTSLVPGFRLQLYTTMKKYPMRKSRYHVTSSTPVFALTRKLLGLRFGASSRQRVTSRSLGRLLRRMPTPDNWASADKGLQIDQIRRAESGISRLVPEAGKRTAIVLLSGWPRMRHFHQEHDRGRAQWHNVRLRGRESLGAATVIYHEPGVIAILATFT
jgi:hypothetical protein